jgi:hypothetical protein
MAKNGARGGGRSERFAGDLRCGTQRRASGQSVMAPRAASSQPRSRATATRAFVERVNELTAHRDAGLPTGEKLTLGGGAVAASA